MRRAADDDACLATVRDGTADAAITSAVLETDLTAHGGVAILGTGPVLTEPRAILIDARPGGDELRTAIEAALTEIRD